MNPFPPKVVFVCKHCKKGFTARTADRRRGWARFCSKRCAAIARNAKR